MCKLFAPVSGWLERLVRPSVWQVAALPSFGRANLSNTVAHSDENKPSQSQLAAGVTSLRRNNHEQRQRGTAECDRDVAPSRVWSEQRWIGRRRARMLRCDAFNLDQLGERVLSRIAFDAITPVGTDAMSARSTGDRASVKPSPQPIARSLVVVDHCSRLGLTRSRRQNGAIKDAILTSNPVAFFCSGFHHRGVPPRNAKSAPNSGQAETPRSARKSFAHVPGAIILRCTTYTFFVQ
jgi:hypothetical protein